jgi:hypothetical protein
MTHLSFFCDTSGEYFTPKQSINMTLSTDDTPFVELLQNSLRKRDGNGDEHMNDHIVTKPAAVEALKPATQANQDLASSIWKEAKDFGEGVFHGSVESPVNGVVQLANHITNSHLPELHLVNENDVDHTIAGQIGSFVGTTADMIGLTVATGGLGGAGIVANTLRLAAVGAVYSGILTPIDEWCCGRSYICRDGSSRCWT